LCSTLRTIYTLAWPRDLFVDEAQVLLYGETDQAWIERAELFFEEAFAGPAGIVLAGRAQGQGTALDEDARWATLGRLLHDENLEARLPPRAASGW
jgi:hypothetical protein